MATTKKRLNISLASDLEEAIMKISKRDQIPVATKASQLLRLALEIEEDEVWDTLAQGREKEKVNYLSHTKVWK